MKKLFTTLALASIFSLGFAQDPSTDDGTTVTILNVNYTDFVPTSGTYPTYYLNGPRYDYSGKQFGPIRNDDITLRGNMVAFTVNTQGPLIYQYPVSSTAVTKTYGIYIAKNPVMVTGVQAGDIVTVITDQNSITPLIGFESTVTSTPGTVTTTNANNAVIASNTHVLTVSESGNAVFQSAVSAGLQSVKITRKVTASDPYVGSALNAYVGTDLESAQENMNNGVAGVPISGNTETAAIFGSSVSNLALVSSDGGYFNNSNLATGYVDNGNNYIPLYLAPGEYQITANNVSSATMYLYTAEGNNVTVTYPNTDGTGETKLDDINTTPREIQFGASTGKTITINGGYAYAVFFINRKIEATATVNLLGTLPWNPGVAGGTWQGENTLANFVTVTTTSEDIQDADVYASLSIDIQPTFDIYFGALYGNQQPKNSGPNSRKQMPDWIYNQLVSIQSGTLQDGTSYSNKVDGWYLPVGGTLPIATATLNEDGTLLPGENFPCSGEYKITVTTSNPNINIKNYEQTVSFYPPTDLHYTYQLGDKDYTNEGLNIRGFEVNARGTIQLPEELSQNELSNMVLYTPGVYPTATNLFVTPPDGNMYYSLVDEEVESVDNLSWTTMNPADGPIIDLSSLKTTGKKYLYLKLEKNGASTPDDKILESKIPIELVAGIPTGIEGIEAEGEGTAVYYNLQGVRVDNPQKGIYVKVAGGKASKVIL